VTSSRAARHGYCVGSQIELGDHHEGHCPGLETAKYISVRNKGHRERSGAYLPQALTVLFLSDRRSITNQSRNHPHPDEVLVRLLPDCQATLPATAAHPFASRKPLRFLAPPQPLRLPVTNSFSPGGLFPVGLGRCLESAPHVAALTAAAGGGGGEAQRVSRKGNSFAYHHFNSTYFFQTCFNLFTPLSPRARFLWQAQPSLPIRLTGPSCLGPPRALRSRSTITEPAVVKHSFVCARIRNFRSGLHLSGGTPASCRNLAHSWSLVIGSRQAAALNPYGRSTLKRPA